MSFSGKYTNPGNSISAPTLLWLRVQLPTSLFLSYRWANKRRRLPIVQGKFFGFLEMDDPIRDISRKCSECDNHLHYRHRSLIIDMKIILKHCANTRVGGGGLLWRKFALPTWKTNCRCAGLKDPDRVVCCQSWQVCCGCEAPSDR